MVSFTVSLSQVIDLVLKLTAIAFFSYGVVIMRRADRFIQSAEESAESIERTSEKIGKLAAVSRYLPYVGGKDE